MSTPSRVRLRYFLRSLLPADLGQLSFLVGIVCLIFAARMSWWPRHDGVPLSSLGPLDNAASRISTYGLSVVGGWALILSSFGGYFVCFWPGFRPVRRLLLVILLPAIAGMASFFARFTYLGQSYSSALDANWLASLFRLGQLSSWVASFGFHVAFIGLLLIGIFTARVIRGVSCLPLSLRSASVQQVRDPELWKRAQFLIWLLLGPLFLLESLLGVVLAGVGEVASEPSTTFQSSYFIFSASVFEAIILFAILWFSIGKLGRKIVARCTRFSRPNYLSLAAAFSIGIAVLISSGQYLWARVILASAQLGKFEQPEAGRYFRLPSPLLLSMFFAAFAEEVVFRGFLQTVFIRRYSLYRGIFLTGVVWAAYHFQFDASFAQFDELGAATRVISRLSMCLALGFVLSWLTLRSSSILPAAVAHSLYNILVTGSGVGFPGKSTAWTGLWALLAYFLFRRWSVESSETTNLEPPIAMEPGIAS